MPDDECECWIDNDPLEGFIDERGCPIHDDDLGGCPYYARYCGLEGHDPEAVCFQMGVCQTAGEPQCVTCEPTEGWRAAADLPVQREPHP